MALPAAIAILVLLLIGPLLSHWVEKNLEVYCFFLGASAIGFAGQVSWELAKKVLFDPIPIAMAVLIAGVLFKFGRKWFDRALARMQRRFSRPVLAAIIVATIALLSSLITSIVAALMLVEALRALRLPRDKLLRVTVTGCMAIGLGASLTPLGEPLSTIAVDLLNLEFFALFGLLAPYVLPGIVVCAALVAFHARGAYIEEKHRATRSESLLVILRRGAEVFAFIAGLVLLGEAYAPLARTYLSELSAPVLFWTNVAGAALDNATVVAIEISDMPLSLAREVILSLLASGGMLIQGNIPNIIAANALNISALSWARVGVPIGLLFLIGYFLCLRLA